MINIRIANESSRSSPRQTLARQRLGERLGRLRAGVVMSAMMRLSSVTRRGARSRLRRISTRSSASAGADSP